MRTPSSSEKNTNIFERKPSSTVVVVKKDESESKGGYSPFKRKPIEESWLGSEEKALQV